LRILVAEKRQLRYAKFHRARSKLSRMQQMLIAVEKVPFVPNKTTFRVKRLQPAIVRPFSLELRLVGSEKILFTTNKTLFVTNKILSGNKQPNPKGNCAEIVRMAVQFTHPQKLKADYTVLCRGCRYSW